MKSVTKLIIPELIILLFVIEKYFHFNTSLPNWLVVYFAFGLYLIIKYSRHANYKKNNYFKKSVLLYISILVLSFINVLIYGNMNFYFAVKSYFYVILGACLYFPLSAIRNKYGLESLFNSIICVSLCVSIIMVFQYYGYINIINIVTERNDHIRTFVAIDLASISCLIIVSRLNLQFNLKNTVLLIALSILLFYLINICQTRSSLMALCIGAGVLILYRIKKSIIKNGSSRLLAYLITSVIFCIGAYYVYCIAMETIQSSISINEASSINRIAAYNYYFNLFLKSPIIGIGLTTGDQNSLIHVGINNFLFTDDIGIVGFIAEFGLIGILLVIFIYKRIYEVIHKHGNPFIISYIIYTIVIFPFSFRWAQDDGAFYFSLSLILIESFCNKPQNKYA